MRNFSPWEKVQPEVSKIHPNCKKIWRAMGEHKAASPLVRKTKRGIHRRRAQLRKAAQDGCASVKGARGEGDCHGEGRATN